MGSINKILKKFDMNPATDESFQVRTMTGAISITDIILSYFSLCHYYILNVSSVLGRTEDVYDICDFCLEI